MDEDIKFWIQHAMRLYNRNGSCANSESFQKAFALTEALDVPDIPEAYLEEPYTLEYE